MTKLIIQTQCFENYAWDENGNLGTGKNAYWKAKGGSDYVIKNVDECDMIEIIVDRVRSKIEVSNDLFEEYIIGWAVVPDDYLTPFERDQLEYDGTIAYPATEVEI